MEPFEEKKILVGVCGGISAYKVVDVCRRLIKRGASIKVIMTEAAQRFVTPLTFRTITGHPVATSLFADPAAPIPHISLSEETDLILVAPATADMIAKYAWGIADDLLSTTLLAAREIVVLAPSMNARMYLNPATQKNLDTIRERGARLIEPGEGYLACGYEGVGRLAEPSQIIEELGDILRRSRDLEGKRIVVTAGSTREHVDPARFISNPSSGRMGFALAQAAADRGARVVLVTGPTHLIAGPGIERIDITSAAEMKEAVESQVKEAKALIMAAAVADYRPRETLEKKMKKGKGKWALDLEPTEDILASVSARGNDIVLVGFAAETEDLIENAKKKLEKKKLDMIVANLVGRVDTGFAASTTEAAIITADGEVGETGMVYKSALADLVLDRVAEILKQ